MREEIRIRLLLAKHDDDTEPTAIGCLDETVWEHIDEDVEEEWRAACKRWFGAPSDYEYREAWASFEPEALRAVFDTPELVARVVYDASSSAAVTGEGDAQ